MQAPKVFNSLEIWGRAFYQKLMRLARNGSSHIIVVSINVDVDITQHAMSMSMICRWRYVTTWCKATIGGHTILLWYSNILFARICVCTGRLEWRAMIADVIVWKLLEASLASLCAPRVPAQKRMAKIEVGEINGNKGKSRNKANQM